jgi:hypothetical protein
VSGELRSQGDSAGVGGSGWPMAADVSSLICKTAPNGAQTRYRASSVQPVKAEQGGG